MEKLKNSTYTFSPIGKGEEGSNDIKVNMVAGQSKGSDGWFRNVVSVAVDKKTNRAIVALDITGGASSRLPAIVSFTNINDIPEQKDFVYLNYYRGTIKTVSFNDAGEVLVKFLEKDFTYHLDSLGKLIPVNETKNDSNIDSVINTWKNSDGFVKGEKYDGEHHARSLVNKSTFGSTYFGKTVPYAIMNESSHGNVAGGVWKVIIQPQQTNNTSDFVYEFNRVQGYNPWNIGSDITMNVAQISHELVADGQLLVTFRVSSDINFSNSSNACIKYGDYKATFTLDKVKHMYTPTSKKDVLIEAACLAQNRG